MLGSWHHVLSTSHKREFGKKNFAAGGICKFQEGSCTIYIVYRQDHHTRHLGQDVRLMSQILILAACIQPKVCTISDSTVSSSQRLQHFPRAKAGAQEGKEGSGGGRGAKSWALE